MLSLPDLGRVHDQYLALSQIAEAAWGGSLGGRLLLRSGFDADGIAVLVAASIAGAASLCADAEGALLRDGLRHGFCDFVVNSLDEALRILKNEVRRARPVSVGLSRAPHLCIEEMLERGLQPDLVSPGAPEDHARLFLERGAIFLHEGPADVSDTSLQLWSVAVDPARTMPRMAQLAADTLDPDGVDTAARRHWLEASPRYLGRAFGSRQCLRMSTAEAAAFLDRAKVEFPSVSFARQG